MNLQNCIVASLNQASEQCFRPCLPDDFERSQNHQPYMYEEQAKTTTHHHCFTLLEPRMKGLPHTQGKEETRNLVRRIRLYILMRVLLEGIERARSSHVRGRSFGEFDFRVLLSHFANECNCDAWIS